jgi:hypothetical protein
VGKSEMMKNTVENIVIKKRLLAHNTLHPSSQDSLSSRRIWSAIFRILK